MQLSRLTDPTAVTRALDECDTLGRDVFLARHGFERARRYYVVRNGRLYDSKAIFGVAWGYQFPSEGPLGSQDFSGGGPTVVYRLRRLGFEIPVDAEQSPQLQPGRTYSWHELGELFGFRPRYLAVAGGMVPRPDHNAVLVITHPGGAKSFDYDDYWDGDDLIYTGRGKRGHQQLDGANGDVADNRREILAFEHAGPSLLTYLGTAHCAEWWPDSGPDDTGEQRRIYRFRLRFSPTAAVPKLGENGTTYEPAAPLRRPRSFDKSSPPSSYRQYARRADPEETRALQEKATLAHHALLAELTTTLERQNWLDIQEIPAAVDLWARPPAPGLRVIFEAKTVSAKSSAARLRSALGQLLEYRFFWGRPMMSCASSRQAPSRTNASASSEPSGST